ncbi:hypothetical protein HBP98_02685 [Listeria booriae]|uniref:Tetratricopeptide repeat protein n=1 Tax=Listeria booriae TaxID=1552123 RepID=A0A7X1A429_9LIST|nr:hypothetical protein [Listeria booriae]MBC2370904.1 hypothetical protein [Listeria booriae]
MISTRVMKFEALMKLVDNGELEEARKIAQSYVEAQPRNFVGYLCLAYVAFAGDKDKVAAEAYVEETLRHDPRCEEAMRLGVMIWTGSDNAAKEKYYIEKGMRYASREAFYPYRMGILLEAENLTEAAPYFEKAAGLDARNAEYVGKYSNVMYQLGKKKVARDYMQRALGLDANHTENVRNFAQWSFEDGHFKMARDLSERVLKKKHDAESARLVRQAAPTSNWLVAMVLRIGLLFITPFKGRKTAAKMMLGFVLGLWILCIPLFFISNLVGIIGVTVVLALVVVAGLISNGIRAKRQLGVEAPKAPVKQAAKPVIQAPPAKKIAETKPSKQITREQNREVNPPLAKKATQPTKINPKVFIVPAIILAVIGFGLMEDNSADDYDSYSYDDMAGGSEEADHFFTIRNSLENEEDIAQDDIIDESFYPVFEKLMSQPKLKEQFSGAYTTGEYLDDGELQYLKIEDYSGDLLFLTEFKDYKLHGIYGTGWNDTEAGKARYTELLQAFDEEFGISDGILEEAHMKLIQASFASNDNDHAAALTMVGEDFQDTFTDMMNDDAVKNQFIASTNFVFIDDSDYQYLKMTDNNDGEPLIAQFEDKNLVYMYGADWSEDDEDQARYEEILSDLDWEDSL